MKTRYLILIIVLITSFNSLFANMEAKVNANVRKNFEQEFSAAQNTQWSIIGSLSKATFTLDGQEWYAFYSETGERVALGRNIPISNLPFNLTEEIYTSYKSFWITSAFEVSAEDESAYFVTIESADQKITLKSVGITEWLVFKSSNKE